MKNTKKQQLTPTDALQWRAANNGKVIYLPSGKVARVRPVGVDLFVTMGKIPDGLTPLITEMFNTGAFPIDKVENFAGVKSMMQLLDTVCILCFLEPKVVSYGEVPGDGQISIEDVELDDKWALLDLFGMPASKLASFREEQKPDVATVSGEQDNGRETVHAAESVAVGQ